VTALTRRATDSTFYAEGLSPEQLASLERVVRISADTALAARASDGQLFTAAFVGGSFAGYMIATVHAPDDRELDWMMVDPAFHGSGVADVLMRAGMEWLGIDRPMWLNVIQHNERAIRFYRKHGFEVDAGTRTDHTVPHFIMRRGGDRKATWISLTAP
jgi:ribosomal protein S18 acetylase RimI-like enzyme